MRLKFKNTTILKDALYNLHTSSGASDDYCKGLVMGIVSAQMALGLTFEQSLDTIAAEMPHTTGTRLAVPETWAHDLRANLLARGEYFG